MVEKEIQCLRKMDLTKLTKDDTFVEHEDEWASRKYLFDKLVESDLIPEGNKPKGTYFEVAENPEDKHYISCHLMIPVVVLEANITNNLNDDLSNLLDDQDIKIEAEYTWAVEEAAEWSIEHMTFDEFTPKNKFGQLYRHTSNPETYTISNYYEYIPTHVKNAENKYKQKFFNKHVRTHNNLRMNMIKLSYRVFKCNLALTSPQKIDSHYKKVHFLPKGYLSLKKRETIALNRI